MDTTAAILASIVRTVVPVLVGLVLSVPVLGDLDSTALETVFTGAITGAYYAIVRWLEVNVAPSFGWLLGLARTPSYEAA